MTTPTRKQNERPGLRHIHTNLDHSPATKKPRKPPNLFKRNPKNPATYLVRCPNELMAKARKAAHNRRISLASYIRECIVLDLIDNNYATSSEDAYT